MKQTNKPIMAQDYLIMGECLMVCLIQYAIERKNSEIRLQKTVADLEAEHQKIIRQQQDLIEEERLNVLLQTAGSMAHELNQPLMVLLGNLELMEIDAENRENQLKYIERVRASGQRMADTVLKLQTIRHYKTKRYLNDSRIIDLEQD